MTKKYGNIAVDKNKVIGVTLRPPCVFFNDGRSMSVDLPSAEELLNSYASTIGTKDNQIKFTREEIKLIRDCVDNMKCRNMLLSEAEKEAESILGKITDSLKQNVEDERDMEAQP